MNTASILIKVDPEVKAKAQKAAKKMGLNLSVVINHYLKDFITSKSLTFDYEDEEPTEYMIKAMKEAEADVKVGRVITFNNIQEERDYLNKLIADDKRRNSSY